MPLLIMEYAKLNKARLLLSFFCLNNSKLYSNKLIDLKRDKKIRKNLRLEKLIASIFADFFIIWKGLEMVISTTRLLSIFW